MKNTFKTLTVFAIFAVTIGTHKAHATPLPTAEIEVGDVYACSNGDKLEAQELNTSEKAKGATFRLYHGIKSYVDSGRMLRTTTTAYYPTNAKGVYSSESTGIARVRTDSCGGDTRNADNIGAGSLVMNQDGSFNVIMPDLWGKLVQDWNPICGKQYHFASVTFSEQKPKIILSHCVKEAQVIEEDHRYTDEIKAEQHAANEKTKALQKLANEEAYKQAKTDSLAAVDEANKAVQKFVAKRDALEALSKMKREFPNDWQSSAKELIAELKKLGCTDEEIYSSK